MSRSTASLCVAGIAASLVFSLGGAATAATSVDPTAPVIARLSVLSGPLSGGQYLTLVGDNLATKSSDGTWVAPTVKFGETAVPSADVAASDDGLVRVKEPAASAAGKVAVTVTVGGKSVTKAGFSYTVAAPTASAVAGTATSEAGGTGDTVTGTYLTGAKVSVGGKALKALDVSVAEDGKTVTYKAPAGLVGAQDVLVTTKGGTIDAGTLTYTAKVPTITAIKDAADTGAVADLSSGVAHTVTVEGTNLDVVTKAVLHDKATTGAVPDQVLTIVKATTNSDKRLALATKAGFKPVADGDVVLSTPYASSTPDATTSGGTDHSALTVHGGAAPTLTATMKLGTEATSLVVAGKNLKDITSITYGGVAVALGKMSSVASDGTEFTLAVPAKAVTKDTPVPLVITTDFGKVTATVTVAAATSPTIIDIHAFTVGDDTGISLTASEALVDVANLDGTWIVGKQQANGQYATLSATFSVSGGKVTAHVGGGQLKVGDAISVAYKGPATPTDATARAAGVGHMPLVIATGVKTVVANV